jgi:1-pyrroline-5-carboxylate dehydrogenase
VKTRVEKIEVGDPRQNKPMGPVVSERAYKSILNYIEIGKGEGRLIAGGNKADGPGWYIQPTVIADIKPGATIEQEEIFGPVLAVIKAKNFDEALKIANGTKYGLTGAVYSENPEKLDRAADEFFVGNLYLNRKCTGALVGVHPFGGFNLSGTDSKAGGPDYLLLFLQAKSVARKMKGAAATAKKGGAKKAPAKKSKAAASTAKTMATGNGNGNGNGAAGKRRVKPTVGVGGR